MWIYMWVYIYMGIHVYIIILYIYMTYIYIWLKLTSVTSTTQLTSWFPRTTAEPSTGYSRFSHSAAPAFAGEIALKIISL